MTTPIVYYVGRTGDPRNQNNDPEIPSAWYINGQLVAAGISREVFFRQFSQTRFGDEHFDGVDIMKTLDAVDENGKLQRIEQISKLVAHHQKSIDEWTEELDKLSKN